MRRQVFRLGAAALLLGSALLSLTPLAQAQDQTALANSANSAMQQMSTNLSTALKATNAAAGKASVQAAIAAGESAVADLTSLVSIASDDVVRSRSQAALDQTRNAVTKARAALSQTGDAFASAVNAALGEVNEAIAEFAPVLGRVPAAATVQALPQAGEGDVTPVTMAGGLALSGLIVLAGAALRRRALSTA